MSTELEQQIRDATDADRARPYPLYDSPYAPTYYPAVHFVRKLTMVQLDEGGIPEVIPA